MADYLELSLAKLEEFEGAIPWMYRDTAGHVTVGVGLMLPDAGAAGRLPFELEGVPAEPAAIAAEFARVDALPVGRPALFYRGKGKPELAPAASTDLLRTVVQGFEGKLREALPGYDALPDPVKMALLDMAYNLGLDGLLKGFPRLMRAVESGDWTQAASCCERRGPGAARNQWTRQMFLSSVVPHLQAAAERAWARLGYGLLGAVATAFERIRRR